MRCFSPATHNLCAKYGAMAILLFFITTPRIKAEQHAEKLKQTITPELVVGYVLKQGIAAKKIELERQKTSTDYYSTLAIFEPKLTADLNYTDSQAESFAAASDTETQTLGVDITLSKSFSTGSQISLSYLRNSQRLLPTSITSPISASTQTLDTMNIELTQNLIRNSFGEADQDKVASSTLNKESGDLQHLEDLEDLALETMEIFWDAYVAKENLAKSLSARDRYVRLVNVVRRKAKLGFTGPGELSRIEAEYETQVQQVKKRSALYLNMIDQLEVQLKVEFTGEVEFDVTERLPPLPHLKAIGPTQLRPYKIAQSKLKQSQLRFSSEKSNQRPALDFVIKTSLTGLDEEASIALSEVTGATKPLYYIGFKWESYIGNNTHLGALQTLNADREIQKHELQSVLDQLAYELKSRYRLAESEFLVAGSAIRSLALRKKSAQQIEHAYRQGRQTISELILNLDKLFESESALIRAQGDYHIALNRWAATRDELILSPKQTKKAGN